MPVSHTSRRLGGSAVPSPTPGSSALPLAALAVAGALTLIAYLPVAGVGFQSDDFRWLWHARFAGLADLARIFGETLGFYRPFTQLLWALDLWRAGTEPLAFFGTNLALHLTVLALFAGVARRLLRDPLAAAAATLLAALAHHYNNMAVNWISGRGALLGAAAALAAIWLWDRWCRGEGGAAAWLGACAAVAVGLGAYEAVAGVPLLLAAMLRHRGEGRRPWWSALGPVVLWAPYVWIRIVVGARQPWSEGEGYAYEAAAVLPNLIEYTGRALMVDAVFVMVVALAAGAAGLLRPAAERAAAAARPVVAIGGLWFVFGLLPGLPVSNRSSLYVYFAALGVHLIVGASLAGAGRSLWRCRPVAARVAAAVAVLVVLIGWLPFAWDRNHRIADQGRLATAAIEAIREAVPDPGADGCVILIDDPERRPNLRQAFGDDLTWLGAHVYGEPPSARIRYAEQGGDACRRAHRLRLSARENGPVLRPVVPPSSAPR